jgi:hemoglobin/transferrin/lactoferrin receptor protein
MLVNEDPDVQFFSGYRQYDMLYKVLLKLSESTSHALNVQYSTTGNVPRYDRLSEYENNGILKYSEWYYGPQARTLISYAMEMKKDTGFFDDARLLVSYQTIEESRHDRKFQKNNRNSRTEYVDIFSINADISKMVKKHELRYGVEAANNYVTSTAKVTDIVSGTEAKTSTRYPDGGSTMQWFAGYLTHTYEFSDKIIINGGARFTDNYLSARFIDTTFFPFPFKRAEQKSSALTGNLGVVLKSRHDWRVTLTGSSGFRTPNVDDLAKVFESIPGSVIVPNPDLKPEYSYNAEAGISKIFSGKTFIECMGYYTWLRDVISVKDFKLNGQDSVVYDGQLSRVLASQNSDEGYICGISANLAADIVPSFSMTSSITYTYGRIVTDSSEVPLDHIPPVFGRTSFLLNIKKFRGEFFVMYNGWKRLADYNISGEDNFQYATPYGMPAWYTLNVRASLQANKNMMLQGAVENILDANYRTFGSGISAPGRNFTVTLRVKV